MQRLHLGRIVKASSYRTNWTESNTLFTRYFRFALKMKKEQNVSIFHCHRNSKNEK